jgi:23S rRNA (uridine2552-2'-O)-methyltransferase
MQKNNRSRWLQAHRSDPYVKNAKYQGYRSRAVYKLKEINDRDKLIKPSMTVIDLGAAPGGWSQLVSEIVGKDGTIIAIDILPMEPVTGVMFIQGDFRDQSVLNQLLATLTGRAADLVISDMAPNISGIKAIDQTRSMYLAELTVELASMSLKKGGNLLVKVFQGEGFDALRRDLQNRFATVVVRKPKSSRPQSSEIYLLAKNYRAPNNI